jgi:L-ascorbate metabolism protein UlaG (beta-lactamase superfamily)
MTPPASDHFNGKTFFQPGGHPERGLRDVLRWRLTSRPTRWPRRVELMPQTPPPAPRGAEFVATWLGHASFLVQTRAANLLFDPVFSERVSPFRRFGPRRVHEVPLTFDRLPYIHVVCLSHDHYDHFDERTIRELAQRFDPLFVAPLRHRELLTKSGARRIVELDWWQSHTVPSRGGGNLDLELTLTPAKHWSNRLGSPRNFRLWGGYFVQLRTADFGLRNDPADHPNAGRGASSAAPIEIRESKIENTLWFVADTGYDQRLFRSVRDRCGAPHLALVPIGAYEPRWFMAPMHMNPAEAVQLHLDVGAQVSVGMHWGTFQLTDEGREDPLHALAAALKAKEVNPSSFRVLAPGASVVV